MELDTLAGPQWAGWTITAEQIFAPEWRAGLSPGDIRALPYLNASVAEYRKRARIAEAAAAEMEALALKAEHAARYYRSLVRQEARYGLMFSCD